jgi:hypothetical protein
MKTEMSNLPRPEYVRCIMLSKESVWCGREYSLFHKPFLSIDHAATSRMEKSRLLVCTQCAAKINQALTKEGLT